MAILSKRLNLQNGVWQELVGESFVIKKHKSVLIELVNADSLPVGIVPESFRETELNFSGEFLHIPAPKLGKIYIRLINSEGEGVVTYYASK